MKEWFTPLELADMSLPGVPTSERGVQKRAIRENWKSRPREASGGGKEYHLSSLPEEARQEYARRAAKEAGTREYQRYAVQPMDSAASNAAALEFNNLPQKARDRAGAKAAIVAAFNFYRAGRVSGSFRAAAIAFSDAYQARALDLPDEIHAEITELNPALIRMWSRRATEQGASGLAGRYGNRKGQGLLAEGTPMHELVRAILFKSPQTSAATMWEAIKDQFPGQKIPSLRSVQAWRADFTRRNAGLVAKMTDPDGWKNKHMPAFGNASEHIVRLNQRWEMDGTPTDIMLSDGRRYNITGCIDVYSRRVKFLLSPTASVDAACMLLRRCVVDWGMPEEVGHDNGNEYVSARFQAGLINCGITPDRAQKFSGEQKPFIERVFGTMAHGMVEALPGFIGHNVADRKKIEATKSFAQRLMKKSKGKEDAPVEIRMSPEEFAQWLDDWTNGHYMQRPHSELPGKKTPWQMVAEWTAPVARIENERALDILLAPLAGTRQVGKKGISLVPAKHLKSVHYIAPELGGMIGKTVLLRKDETDIGRVYVFDDADKFVCAAICPALAGTGSVHEIALATKERVKAESAVERKREKALIKKINPTDIILDIAKKKAVEAGKLVQLPSPSTPVTNAALDQAGRAAKAGQGPLERAESMDAIMFAWSQAEEAKSRTAEIIPIPMNTAPIRFRRAFDLIEAEKAGGVLSDEDRLWLSRYQTSPEFSARMKIYQKYGELVFSAG